MSARLRTGAAAVVLAATMTACSDDAEPTAVPPSMRSSSAPAQAVFDPPTRFAAVGIDLGDAQPENVLLHASSAFVATDAQAAVIDLRTGRQTALLRPTQPAIIREPAVGQRAGHTPVLIDPAGRPAVVVPYAVNVPASGTVEARQAVELLVADATTGQLSRTVLLDAKPAEGDFSVVAEEYVRVVAGRGTIVVLTIGKQVTVAVDVSTGSTLWRKNDFHASALLGETVIGLTAPNASYQRSITGLALADGAKRWSALTVANAELAAAGPSFVVAVGQQNDGKRFYALVQPDGTLSNRAEGAYGAGLSCHYDEAAVTVCAIGDSAPLFALDSTTGKDLWELPATGRRAPKMTAAWHGAVYGIVNNAPVVLDAGNGTDRQLSPGVAPTAVTASGGVAAAEQAGSAALSFYPAVG